MPVKTPMPTFRRVVPLVALAAGVAGILVLRPLLKRAPGTSDGASARTAGKPHEARSAPSTSSEAARPLLPTTPVVGTPGAGVALDEALIRVDEPTSLKDLESQRGTAEEPVKATHPIVQPPGGMTVEVPPAFDPSAKAAAARGHGIIDKLKALSSGEDQWLIHESISDLVYLGEPVVPEILGILESGFDKAYALDPTTRSGRYYTRLRMILLDTLRQMRTPAANRALLQSVRKTGLLADCNDLLVLCPVTDPDLGPGVAALTLDALKKVRAIGLEDAERRHPGLVRALVSWIQWHSLKETQATIEEILLASPYGTDLPLWVNQCDLLRQLARFSIERTVDVLVRWRAKSSGDRFIADMSSQIDSALSLSRLVEYYELLFVRVPLSSRTREGILYGLPSTPILDPEHRDFARETEDAKVLLRFLEKRLSMETNPDLKAALESKLGVLKDSIAKIPK